MNRQQAYSYLTLIVVVVLALRLIVAFNQPFFDLDSYFSIRQVNHITETGVPVFHDQLSYGGRVYYFPPLFHYLIAAGKLALPKDLAFRLLPNIFAVSLVVIIFFIAKELTNSYSSSLTSAFIAGFIPIFFISSGTVSQNTLIFPIFFLMILCLLRLDKSKAYAYWFIILSLALSLTSHSAILFVLSLVAYLILARSFRVIVPRSEFELIGFSTVLTLWIGMLIYQEALLSNGWNIIWQNLPKETMLQDLATQNLFQAIYQAGAIPFIVGLFTLYFFFFEKKNRKAFLFTAILLLMSFWVWLKLVTFDEGLVLLGGVMAILFAKFFQEGVSYIDKSRFSNWKTPLLVVGWFLLIVTLVVPSLVYAFSNPSVVSVEESSAFGWLANNAPANTTVVATPEEGYFISATGHKNVADTNHLFIQDVNTPYQEIDIMYTTFSETEALKIIEKYDINYIIFSDRVRSKYNITSIRYSSDRRCFTVVYNASTIIYQTKCGLVER